MTTKELFMFSDNVRETFRNRSFHRYNLMKRIINFNLYVLSWDGSKHVVDERRVDLTRMKFKDIIKTNKVKQILPLPTNKISKLIGCFKGKHRRINYMPRYEPHDTVKYYLQSVLDGFDNFLDNKCIHVFPGAWKYNCALLVDMLIDHKIKYTSENIIDDYLLRVGNDLHLPKISFIKPEYILGLKTKQDSYQDTITSIYVGNRRANSISHTKGVAYHYVKYICNSIKQI